MSEKPRETSAKVEDEMAMTQPGRTGPASIDPAAVGRNRRRFTRVTLDAQVAVRIASTDGGFESRLRDLSTNGVFILTPETRPIGTGLELNITVTEGAHTVRARGIIVHEVKPEEATDDQPAGIGVMFLEVEEGQRALDKLLECGEPAS